MKLEIMKIYTYIMVVVYLILSPLNIFAQTIAAKDGLGQSCVSIKDDMKSYEIVYKVYTKEYADYYREVREKIVRKLRNNYRDHYSDGDVYMCFVLNSNGSLHRIDFDLGKSTKDKELINTALISLQQAAPFQPFPKELSESQLTISLTVSFKENNN